MTNRRPSAEEWQEALRRGKDPQPPPAPRRRPPPPRNTPPSPPPPQWTRSWKSVLMRLLVLIVIGATCYTVDNASEIPAAIERAIDGAKAQTGSPRRPPPPETPAPAAPETIAHSNEPAPNLNLHATATAMLNPTPSARPTTAPWPAPTRGALATESASADPWSVPVSTPTPFVIPTANPLPDHTLRPQQILASKPSATESGEMTETFSGLASEAVDRGKALNDNGEYAAAIAEFEQALQMHGRPSAVIHNDIGLAYLNLGDFSNAVHHLTLSLEVQDNSTTRAERAEAYYYLDRCDLVKEDAIAALNLPEERDRVTSAHQNAHGILADCYTAEENYPAAIRHQSQALEIERELPNSQSESSLLEYMAWMHYLNGDCASAETAAGHALNIAATVGEGYHSHAEAHWVLIFCLTDAERWDNALEHAERALDLAIRSGYQGYEVDDLREWVALLE